jgi:hypothetical protein
MADLVYSSDNLTPGVANNVNEVKAIKTETAAYVNGSGWVTGAHLNAATVAPYKTILSTGMFITAGSGGATYPITDTLTTQPGSATDSTGHIFSSGGSPTDPGVAFTSPSAAMRYYPLRDWYVPINAADFAMTGKTTKLRIRGQVFCNATAPATTFTFTLRPVTSAGGANEVALTAGSAVSGSPLAIATPSANTVTSSAGSDFDLPSDGVYGLCIYTAAAFTANSAVRVACQLQVHHI